MSRTILVKAIGGFEEINTTNKIDYKFIQKCVGGHFQTIPHYHIKKKYHKYMFYVNEEGIPKNFPLNVHMNPFLHEDRPMPYFGGPLGNCLISKLNKVGNNVKMRESEIKMFFDDKDEYIKEEMEKDDEDIEMLDEEKDDEFKIVK